MFSFCEQRFFGIADISRTSRICEGIVIPDCSNLSVSKKLPMEIALHS